MRMLAIDFGTSNTVAALAVDGHAPRTVTFDASPLLPSSVFVAADGQVTTGREAQRQARLDPSRFEPNPKRRIDDGEILLGDRVVPVVDVIAAVLRTVATEVRRQLGGAPPDEVRLTHPAQWGASRQNTLVSAARLAGLGSNLLLLPEPVAAAAQFTRLPGRALPPGGLVAVYDLGGGTFDVAVVGRVEGSDGPGEFHVLAEAGLPDLGGLDFDQAVLDHVGREASGVDPVRWQQVLRPVDASGRRAARALAEDVQAAKETLSRYPQTEVALPDPFIDAHLTRTEFSGLIRTNLVRSVEVLSSTLRSAGVGPDRLTGIFLVGGSSRIPLVAQLIQEQLRVTPVALDQPETAVALGALLVPLRRDGNRTVAIAEGPALVTRGPGGPQPGAGGPSGPLQLQYPSPLVGPGSVGGPPGAPTGPQPPRPLTTGTPRPAGGARRKRSVLVGGSALAVAVVVGLVLVIVKPFSGGSAGADIGTRTTTSSSTVSSRSTPATTKATTGLGPNGVFTLAEMNFMGSSISTLTDCREITAAFNASVVPNTFQVQRAVQCKIPDAIAAPINSYGDQTLMYVLTAKGGYSQGFLDTVVKNRAKLQYQQTEFDNTFTGASVRGRVVTGLNEPGLGKPDSGSTGVSVLAWAFTGEPYVGVVAASDDTNPDDLNNFWASQYKPR